MLFYKKIGPKTTASRQFKKVAIKRNKIRRIKSTCNSKYEQNNYRQAVETVNFRLYFKVIIRQNET